MWGCARPVSQEGVGEAGVVVRAGAAARRVSPGAGEKPGLRSEPVGKFAAAAAKFEAVSGKPQRQARLLRPGCSSYPGEGLFFFFFFIFWRGPEVFPPVDSGRL